MKPIRVLIADDHALMRDGLKRLLEKAGDIAIVGEAGNGAEAMRQIDTLDADLLLLDLNLPDCSGEDLLARIRACHQELPILIVSMHDDPQTVRNALLAGATGYLTKGAPTAVLFKAIRQTASGSGFVDPAVGDPLSVRGSQASTSINILTKREFQILGMIAGGMSVSEIASRLNISDKTVSVHKSRMMNKMGFASNADIVKYQLAQGLGERPLRN